MFASWIPEITELAAQRNKYGGKYNKDVRKRYTGKRCTKWLNHFFTYPLFSDHSKLMIFILLTYMLFIMQKNETKKYRFDEYSTCKRNILSIVVLVLYFSKYTSSTPSYFSFNILRKKFKIIFFVTQRSSKHLNIIKIKCSSSKFMYIRLRSLRPDQRKIGWTESYKTELWILFRFQI